MSDERTQEVATTIFHQLGGKTFSIMTGARHLGFGRENDKDYLSITLPIHDKDRPNKVRIFYDEARDLYNMEFLRVNYKTLQTRTIDTAEGVDVEQMRHTFERVTGLDLSLATEK